MLFYSARTPRLSSGHRAGPTSKLYIATTLRQHSARVQGSKQSRPSGIVAAAFQPPGLSPKEAKLNKQTMGLSGRHHTCHIPNHRTQSQDHTCRVAVRQLKARNLGRCRRCPHAGGHSSLQTSTRAQIGEMTAGGSQHKLAGDA